jgi:hypothetical protein
MRIFSWHYEGMKEDALQKGLPAPDETAVRELVLAKNAETPDLCHRERLPPLPSIHE